MTALTILDHLLKQQLVRRGTTLKEIRNAIDLIDEHVMLLLSERTELARHAAKQKKGKGLRLFNRARENAILRHQHNLARELGLSHEFTTEVFRLILREAKSAQRR